MKISFRRRLVEQPDDITIFITLNILAFCLFSNFHAKLFFLFSTDALRHLPAVLLIGFSKCHVGSSHTGQLFLVQRIGTQNARHSSSTGHSSRNIKLPAVFDDFFFRHRLVLVHSNERGSLHSRLSRLPHGQTHTN